MIGSYAMSKYVNGDKVCYMAEDNHIEDERVMLNWILEVVLMRIWVRVSPDRGR